MTQQTGIANLSVEPGVLPHENRQLNALTGIRALAACWVLAFHFRPEVVRLFPGAAFFSPLMDSGYLGVDLFFGLSGFILAYNYLHRLGKNGKWSDRLRFLWLRLARVWPVHFFTLNVALLMMLVARAVGITFVSQPSDLYTPLTYLENLSLTNIWFGRNVSFNYPSWTVSAEWFAYLLFPLLASAVVRMKSLGGAWVGATACYAALGAAVTWGHAGVTGLAGLQVGLEFLAGCFLFCIWERTGSEMGWRWLAPASAAGVVAGVLTTGAIYPHGLVMAPLFGLLILGLAKDRGLCARALSTRAVVFGGKVSYALYMTHALVLQVYIKLLPVDHFAKSGWVVRAAVLAGYVVMAAVVAVLTYLVVEKPSRNRLRLVGCPSG